MKTCWARRIWAWCVFGSLFLLAACAAPPSALFPYSENAPALNYSGERECLIHKDIAEYRLGQPGPFQIPQDMRGGILFDGTVTKIQEAPGGARRVTFRTARVLQGHAGRSVTVIAPAAVSGGVEFAPRQKYRVYAMPLRGGYYTWRPFAFDVRKAVPPSCNPRLFYPPFYPAYYPHRRFAHHHHH